MNSFHVMLFAGVVGPCGLPGTVSGMWVMSLPSLGGEGYGCSMPDVRTGSATGVDGAIPANAKSAQLT